VLNQMNVAGSTRAIFMPDILGSVIGTFDATGALTKAAYLPYGGSTAAATPFGYTGQRIDTETGGNYYYRARHYSPLLGRFLQADPTGYASGSHLYAYLGNDPLNSVDPSGLASDIPAGGGWSPSTTDVGSSTTGPTAWTPASTPTSLTPSGDSGATDSPLQPVSTPLGSPAAPAAPSTTQYAQMVTPPVTIFARPPILPPVQEFVKPLEPVKPPLEEYPTNPSQPPGPGYEWRGRPGSTPGSNEGNWFNPDTTESLRPDLNHPPGVDPHWDYRAPSGKWYRWFPNGDVILKPGQ
jgi:RHS repeat-associated protein